VAGKSDYNELIANAFQRLLALALVGIFAQFGMIITVLLLVISLFTTLPFSPMWGFIVVPVGIVLAYVFSKKVR
jgi:hypothetical protein